MEPDSGAGAMEQGRANGSYPAGGSPAAFVAVKKNINHISGLNLGLRVAEFILSVIAFSLMASADQNGAVFNNFTSYRYHNSIYTKTCCGISSGF